MRDALEPESKTSGRAPRGAGEVLVVDDNAANLDILSRLLRQHGYRFRVATSGARAIATAQAQPPDLVMLDITMPGANGYEVCEALKADPRTAEVPVIFVSALDDALDKVRAFRAGGADYVSKPFQFEEVVARVENQLKISRLQEALAQRNRELERANHDLLVLSRTDSLTGLANRRHLLEQLTRAWEEAKAAHAPLSVLIVDVDCFKAYNDHYGHQGGDECLRLVAAGLRDSLAHPAAIVGRYGGEEFLLGLPGVDTSEALAMGRGVCDAIRRLALPHARSLVASVVTISAGVGTAGLPEHLALDALLAVADAALYRAKHEGRDRALPPAGWPAPSEA